MKTEKQQKNTVQQEMQQGIETAKSQYISNPFISTTAQRQVNPFLKEKELEQEEPESEPILDNKTLEQKANPFINVNQRENNSSLSQTKSVVSVNDNDVLENESIKMRESTKGIDNKDFLTKTKNIGQTNSSVLQGKFEDANFEDPVEVSVHKLANETASGREAIEKGDGQLIIKSTNEWKTLTKEGYGIGIKDEDYETLKTWGKNTSEDLPNKNQYKILIAHELTHLRHLMEAPGSYHVRGQRGDWDGWDADPEEELTIKGETKISKNTWETKFLEAIKGSGLEAYEKAKSGYETEISKIPPDMQNHSNVQYRNFQKKLNEQKNAIGKIKKIFGVSQDYDLWKNKETMAKSLPKGAKEDEDFYVFTDIYCENFERSLLGFKKRETYSDSSL